MHVRIEGGAIRSDELYGQELAEQTAGTILGSSPNRGGLFMPGVSFYAITDNDSLTAAGHEIFRWLGVKPRHISISFDELPTAAFFDISEDEAKLVVNEYYKKYPLVAAALLCHVTFHYLLDGRNKLGLRDEQANESLVNYLAVEAGLGLIILNGLSFQGKVRRKYTDLFQSSYSLQEIYPKPLEIVANFEQFVAEHRVHYEDYAAHLAPWTKKYLPAGLQPLASYRDREPIHISQVLKKQRKHRTYLLLASVGILLIVGLFRVLQKPPAPQVLTSQQRQQLADIEELYTKTQECEKAVAVHRSTIDRSDFSALQVVEGEQASCASMRNYYDFKRGQFEQSVRETSSR